MKIYAKKKKRLGMMPFSSCCVFLLWICATVLIFFFLAYSSFSSVAIAFLFSKRQKIIPEALPLLVPLLFLSLKRVFRWTDYVIPSHWKSNQSHYDFFLVIKTTNSLLMMRRLAGFSTLQTIIEVSKLPEATRVESGLQATQLTLAVW